VADHKFRVGQRVALAPTILNRAGSGGAYVITKRLPERDGEPEYRIKRDSELHERVARESELVRA